MKAVIASRAPDDPGRAVGAKVIKGGRLPWNAPLVEHREQVSRLSEEKGRPAPIYRHPDSEQNRNRPDPIATSPY